MLGDNEGYPKWIDSLTKEEQYEWYLKIKQSLSIFEKFGDIEKLNQAISDYEYRNNIK